AEPLLVPAAPADAPSASTNAETAASTANLAPVIWPPSGRVSQAAEATILVPHPGIAKSLCCGDRVSSQGRPMPRSARHRRLLVGTIGPKEFAEPGAVSSTSEQCVRLPPSSSPGGFGLVPLRARRDAHAAPIHGFRQLRVLRYLRT